MDGGRERDRVKCTDRVREEMDSEAKRKNGGRERGTQMRDHCKYVMGEKVEQRGIEREKRERSEREEGRDDKR